ncbi:MAG: hypothetical protein F6K54_18135 [Okeania sp. SIO3B5]|uniref:hypothetical protein n=1 Tax=Okeania sp. SIO3B5 TaxID=2607811 RepID=UPI0014004BB4|nr:hypothetical protein [Okeania sp. SIO3B5]NEO54831.1 hypothetical protein [Okeania sp. SIO3B5]
MSDYLNFSQNSSNQSSKGHTFMGIFKKIGKGLKKAGKKVKNAVEDAADSVVDIGEDGVEVIADGAQTALEEIEKVGKLVDEFLTQPLATYKLPDDAGKVKIWIGVFTIYLTKETIDEINDEGDITVALASLVGAIVALSGGTLAPVAGFIAAYMKVEWELINKLANKDGITLSGSHTPPNPLIVPLPGKQ